MRKVQSASLSAGRSARAWRSTRTGHPAFGAIPSGAARRSLAARLALAALALACTASRAAALPAVFDGDPLNGKGKPYVLLPGLPLILPGADGKWHTADDNVDGTKIGDVDIVVRTKHAFVPGGPIPAPAAGVADAPQITAGGLQLTSAGAEAPYTFILSDGDTSVALPAGNALANDPLVAQQLDGRGTLVVVYADLDGDGFVGPTGADGNADDAVEAQEALTFAGRRLALLEGGTASDAVAVRLALPASAGGLGLVVAGGAVTGTLAPLYKNGPWVATLLPILWPVNPNRIIGGEAGAPPDPIGLVDLELELEKMFLPAPGYPGLGTPFAIPLDGSSISNDLLRAVSGPMAGARFAELVDPTAFVADLPQELLPAIAPGGGRSVVQPLRAISLADDGPGNGRTLLVFPGDQLGNAADPAPGGTQVTLEVGPDLRIAVPDRDGDPHGETLTFTSPEYVPLTIDDTGGADDGGTTDPLLALLSGVPAAAIRVSLTPAGAMPTPAPLASGKAVLRHLAGTARDRLRLIAGLDASAASLDVANRDLTLELRDGSGAFYTRTIPAGSLVPGATTGSFDFADPAGVTRNQIVELSIRPAAGNPLRQVLRATVRRMDLSGIGLDMASADLEVVVGTRRFASSVACTADALAATTICTH